MWLDALRVAEPKWIPRVAGSSVRSVWARVGELIGDLGIHMPPDVDGAVEFGASIALAHRSRDYACEAVHALFELVSDRFGRRRINASVDPRNLASMAVRARARHVAGGASPGKPVAAR